MNKLVVYPYSPEFKEHFVKHDIPKGWFGKIGDYKTKYSKGEIYGLNLNERELIKTTPDFYIETFKDLDNYRYAGILPGILEKRFIGFRQDETIAIRNILSVIPHRIPVFLIGHLGRMGKLIFKGLIDRKPLQAVVGIDQGSHFKEHFENVFRYIKDSPHVFLNVSTTRATNEYIEYFNKNTIFVNETYPAPKANGFQIAGTEAMCKPPFPFEYEDVLPLCSGEIGDVRLVNLHSSV